MQTREDREERERAKRRGFKTVKRSVFKVVESRKHRKGEHFLEGRNFEHWVVVVVVEVFQIDFSDRNQDSTMGKVTGLIFLVSCLDYDSLGVK